MVWSCWLYGLIWVFSEVRFGLVWLEFAFESFYLHLSHLRCAYLDEVSQTSYLFDYVMAVCRKDESL